MHNYYFQFENVLKTEFLERKMPYFDFDNNKIFYETYGEGKPLLLLHGNTVSSAMFTSEIEFYTDLFKVIVFDYPGLGKSGRFESFRDDFWYYNSQAGFALLDHLGLEVVDAIGTSGGAIVGLNMAASQPKRINRLIADSFFGDVIPSEEAHKIKKNRTAAMNEVLASSFWEAMNGPDWQSVVVNDFELLVRVADGELPIYLNPLENITANVLLVASREDELITNIENRMNKVGERIELCRSIYFDEGKHPFMITQKEKFREIALNFLID